MRVISLFRTMCFTISLIITELSRLTICISIHIHHLLSSSTPTIIYIITICILQHTILSHIRNRIPVLHLYASLEPYSGYCRYILPFLNIYCVNWNVYILHRYHLSHSVLNKHFIMGDNHTIFTIFYYLRSSDIIWHFFKFVRVIFLSTQLRVLPHLLLWIVYLYFISKWNW